MRFLLISIVMLLLSVWNAYPQTMITGNENFVRTYKNICSVDDNGVKKNLSGIFYITFSKDQSACYESYADGIPHYNSDDINIIGHTMMFQKTSNQIHIYQSIMQLEKWHQIHGNVLTLPYELCRKQDTAELQLKFGGFEVFYFSSDFSKLNIKYINVEGKFTGRTVVCELTNADNIMDNIQLIE